MEGSGGEFVYLNRGWVKVIKLKANWKIQT